MNDLWLFFSYLNWTIHGWWWRQKFHSRFQLNKLHLPRLYIVWHRNALCDEQHTLGVVGIWNLCTRRVHRRKKSRCAHYMQILLCDTSFLCIFHSYYICVIQARHAKIWMDLSWAFGEWTAPNSCITWRGTAMQLWKGFQLKTKVCLNFIFDVINVTVSMASNWLRNRA